MRSMGIRRRQLFGLLAGGLAWPLLPLRPGAATGRCLYLSARADDAGGFRVSAFDADGKPAFDLDLPGRGHSFALRPDGRVAVHFARRPGGFARAVDIGRGTVVHDFETPEGRHFYGHGAFSPDGRLLYATENDFVAGRGVVGVYDATAGFRRVGEMPSHGIGPHELRLMADGTTLAVANGGIATRPDLPRVKLNLPTMRPSLAYIDRRDGRLLKEVRLPAELHQLSIRHLSVGRDDTVAIAMQYEGPAGDRVPLVATHRRDRPVILFDGPAEVLRSMHQYCGSATFDAGGRVLAVSAPRGGLVTFWDAATGNHLSSVAVPDGSGVAPTARPGQFLVSSGQGGIMIVDARSGDSTPIASGFLDGGRWDNHVVATCNGPLVPPE